MLKHLLLALLALLLAPALPADAQQVKLKASLQFPIANPTFGGGLMRLKEEVERQSEGAIAIEIVDKAQLLNDYQVVDGIGAGVADIGMTATQQFSRKVPMIGIFDQPFLFNFDALMRAAAKPGSEIRTIIDEAILAAAGVRVLWWNPLGNTVFLSKGRDLADPTRIKGQRVASPGKLPGAFAAACGGTPVVFAFEKIVQAYKDNAIEMAMGGFGALPAFRLESYVDTVTFTHHAPLTFLLFIDEKRWQALAPEHRTVLARTAAKVEMDIAGFQKASEARARDYAKKHNVKLQGLTPDQVAEWRACSAPMLADYIESVGEPAQKLMAAYAKLRLDPCCSAAPGGGEFTRR